MGINYKKSAKDIAYIAIMSAILIVGKFTLSFIPNVEIVTTLIICFSVVFKFKTVLATLIFCTLDIIIYPPSIDVIVSYFIYWNLLSIIASLMSFLNVKNKNAYIILGIVMTLLFGVITSLSFSLFFKTPFIAVYLAGLIFYAIQIVSTLVFMLIGFNPIIKILNKIH